MKKVLAILIIIGVVFAGVVLLKKRKSTIVNEPLASLPTLTISLIKAKRAGVQKSEKFLGLLESKKGAKISTKLSGYIQNISVVESQKVSKGELLVSIDKRELLTTIRSTEIVLKQQKDDYKLTKKIYKRNVKLYKVGALPQEKLEGIELGLQAKKTLYITTEEKIKQLNIQLTYLDIKAPYDGTIGTIFLQKGNLANPSQPILTLSQLAQKITFSFSPTNNPIKIGESVFVNNKEIGEIKRIYTQAKNGLSVAEVEINTKLNMPEGSFVSIDVIIGEYHGCVVPSNTLLHTKYGKKIMVYENSVFTPHSVDVIFENEKIALLRSCPLESIAQGSQSKLSKLPFYDKVEIRGKINE
ncbi:MAG: efflux RND transporter periplasmic adaptor subunit [Sulfurovum sp.]